MTINEAIFEDIARRLPPGCWKEETSVAVHWLLYGFARMVQPHAIVEVGTSGGDATAFLVRAAIHNGRGVVVGYEADPAKRENSIRKVHSACGPDIPFEMRHAFDYNSDPAELVYSDFAFIDLDPKTAYGPVFDRLSIPLGGMMFAHDLTHPSHVTNLEAFRTKVEQTNEWEMMSLPQERGLIVARKVSER